MFATYFQFAIKLVTRLHMFSRALRHLHVFASSFEWFTGFSAPFVISQREYLEFGSMTLSWKSLYLECFTCTLFHETSAGTRNVAGSWKKKYIII